MDQADFATTLSVSHCSTPRKVRLQIHFDRKLENSSCQVFEEDVTRSSTTNHSFSNEKRKWLAQGFPVLSCLLLLYRARNGNPYFGACLEFI